MTTLLPVDPAYALDYLAILRVKFDSGLPVFAELTRVDRFLSAQFDNYDLLLVSAEFKRLLVANQLTFDAIELAHQNKISARKVQQINYRRYLAKKAMQERFWPKQALAETKSSLTKRR